MTERPNILLLVIDCLRGDHLYLFRDTRILFRNGVGFTNAWATGPNSDTNFASILTGRHPDTHQVLTQCMDTVLPTLPNALRDAGYDTLGASVRYSDGPPAGLSSFYMRGFEHWVWLSWKGFEGSKVWEQLSGLTEPWFALVRPMDLHEASPGPQRDYCRRAVYLDTKLNHFLGYTLTKFPDTVVVIMADHGQALGENGLWNHREGLYWFVTYVPVFFLYHSFSRAMCDRFFQHMDIAATLAGLIGLDFQTDGIDWSGALVRGKQFMPKQQREYIVLMALVQQTRAQWKEARLKELEGLWLQRAYRDRNWFYFESRRKNERKQELYDLNTDKLEENNLLADGQEHPEVNSLVDVMGWPELPWLEDYDEEAVLKQLRAIGYAL